jgi:hypothetical protein
LVEASNGFRGSVVAMCAAIDKKQIERALGLK